MSFTHFCVHKCIHSDNVRDNVPKYVYECVSISLGHRKHNTVLKHLSHSSLEEVNNVLCPFVPGSTRHDRSDHQCEEFYMAAVTML